MFEVSITALVVFLSDQISKKLVACRQPNVPLGCQCGIVRVLHRKSSYAKFHGRLVLASTWLTAWFCVALLCRLEWHFQSHLSLCGLGAMLGGSAGNLSDILRQHAVVDFINLGWWPVFNVADVAIVVGLGAAFLGS